MSSYIITPTGNDSRMTLRLAKPDQGIRPEEGFFLVNSERNLQTYYARLTGRTTSRWGYACPTMELYRVDTTVIDDAIWGVRGERVAGTWFVRPEALAEIAP